jgi:hypothetical protein
VTNEDEALVRKKIEQAGMKFPVARTSGDSAERAYGVKGFPSTFLIDAGGRLVWSGHPAELDETKIRDLLSLGG